MKIIGITGTIGAGKGTVVEYLVTHHGFTHFSARALLVEELSKRGIEHTRSAMLELANEWRDIHSPSYILEVLYGRAQRHGGNAILESVRSLGEVDWLRRQNDFFLLGIDADVGTRYTRILERGSSTDHITFEQFVFEEGRELESQDIHDANLRGCLAQADYVIDNNQGFEELRDQIEKFYSTLT